MPNLNDLLGNKDRGDGRKFTHKDWRENQWVEPIFKDCFGTWHCLDHSGQAWIEPYGRKSEMTEWKEPSKAKKVKLYCPVESYGNGVFVSAYRWSSDKEGWKPENNIVGWLEQEVEVTE